MKKAWTVGNYISDCPQKDWLKTDIVVDSNGIKQLLVKAGSKVYYPDGLDSNNNPNFSIRTQTSDVTTNTGATGTINYIVTLREGQSVYLWDPKSLCLGVTYENTPALTDIHWWDTTNNVIKATADSGSTWSTSYITLPIGMAHCEAGIGITSFIPFTFCGCMGNGVFSLPLTAQIGNGYDSDNNPVNAPFTNQSVGSFSYDLTSARSNLRGVLLLRNGGSLAYLDYNISWLIQDDTPTQTSGWWYQPKNNQMYSYLAENSAWTKLTGRITCARFDWNSTQKRITDFRPFATLDELSEYYS